MATWLGLRASFLVSTGSGKVSAGCASRSGRVDDGPIIAGINAGWASTHPAAAPLVAFAVDDDGMLLWLSDRSTAAQAYAKQYLLGHTAPANLIPDAKGVYSATVQTSGLSRVYTGRAADSFVHTFDADSHAPDLIGVSQVGVVYTGGVKKIAEHGGDAPDDLDVPLVVSGGAVANHRIQTQTVKTTQIAPTILSLLGLDPAALDAVRTDHTQVLPGL